MYNIPSIADVMAAASGRDAPFAITDEIEETGDSEMDRITKIALVLNDTKIRTVLIAHNENELEAGRGYTYLVRADLAETLEPGDVVLLEPKNKRPSSGYVVAVEDVQSVDVDSAFNYKWVMQKFDPAPVEEYKDQLGKAVKRIQKQEREGYKDKLRESLRRPDIATI